MAISVLRLKLSALFLVDSWLANASVSTFSARAKVANACRSLVLLLCGGEFLMMVFLCWHGTGGLGQGEDTPVLGL